MISIRLLSGIPPKSGTSTVGSSQQARRSIHGSGVVRILALGENHPSNLLIFVNRRIVAIFVNREKFRETRATELGPCLHPIRVEGDPLLIFFSHVFIYKSSSFTNNYNPISLATSAKCGNELTIVS